MEYQKDRSIGFEVHQHLVSLGLETPFDSSVAPNHTHIEYHFQELMKGMGLNLSDDSLAETPKRMAKMWINEIFYGLNYDNFPKATKVENKFKYDELVLERNIIVNSTCEHHLLPIVGNAFVAYIPEKPVVGLSKLNRIVDFFARRPQVQERLTAQIFETLKYLLQTENVAVIIEAEHLCVKTRGVQDPCSDTITSQLGGKFRDPAMRAEFIALAKGLK